MTTETSRRGNITLALHAQDVVPYMLLLLGLGSLFMSAFSSSYVLAFIGLGLVFWGTIFLYVKFTKYVKIEILTAASSSSMQNIERILAQGGTSLKGIYLPPGNLRDYASSLVFIPKKPDQPLPKSAESDLEQLQPENPAGLFVTPPGLGLSNLFEKQMKRSFTETTLKELKLRLSGLFDELQITKHLTIEIGNNSIAVRVSNHVFKDLCEEAKRLPRTYYSVGSPLSSALACAFAKATGKPLRIEKEETASEATSIVYSILED